MYHRKYTRPVLQTMFVIPGPIGPGGLNMGRVKHLLDGEISFHFYNTKMYNFCEIDINPIITKL